MSPSPRRQVELPAPVRAVDLTRPDELVAALADSTPIPSEYLAEQLRHQVVETSAILHRMVRVCADTLDKLDSGRLPSSGRYLADEATRLAAVEARLAALLDSVHHEHARRTREYDERPPPTQEPSP